MGVFITEDWLRSHSNLSAGTEIRLPAGARLTPAAQGLLTDRRISVKFVDEDGRLFVIDASGKTVPDGAAASAAPALKQVHALTSDSERHTAVCQLCQQAVDGKPDTMTHLDARTLVPKNDPRLLFRGQMDSAIATAVWLQVELGDAAHGWLDDIRSVLGNIMRAEVTGETLGTFAVGGLSPETIHVLSHNPLATLGHDHLVPEAAHGRASALLNMLRTKVRECELAAAQVYINRDFSVGRPDIMQGLNRLSSAVYVLMILSVLAATGKPWPSMEALRAAAERR